MNFSFYQDKALETALYPNINNNILYPILGLMGESGEVIGKIKKMIRDDSGLMTSDRRAAIKDELGDLLWYCAAICHEGNLNMETLYVLAKASLTNIESMDIFRLNLRLFQQIAHMSILVEQSIFMPATEGVDVLEPLASDMVVILATIIEICTACALDIEQVAQLNLEKLVSRQERGVLQGSGDNR